MRLVVPVALVLALASCTSSGTPKPAAKPSVSITSARSLVVAVTVAGADPSEVLLFRVGEDRRARLLRRVSSPPGSFELRGVSLTNAVDPRVCTMWSADEPEGDGGGEEGVYCDGVDGPLEVPRDGDLGDLAVDPAGRRLFWTSYSAQTGTTGYTVADLGPHGLSHPLRHELDCPNYVRAAVWSGASRLVLHCSTGDNDDPGRLAVQEIGASAAQDIPEGHERDGYDLYLDPGGVVGDSVLAIEGQDCELDCALEHRLPSRAVRVDLRTGRVVEVIATPAKGRYLHAVSGGAHGIVYVTDAEGKKRDVRVYLRWPGEKHGTPITGLPADIDTLVAQP